MRALLAASAAVWVIRDLFTLLVGVQGAFLFRRLLVLDSPRWERDEIALSWPDPSWSQGCDYDVLLCRPPGPVIFIGGGGGSRGLLDHRVPQALILCSNVPRGNFVVRGAEGSPSRE